MADELGFKIESVEDLITAATEAELYFVSLLEELNEITGAEPETPPASREIPTDPPALFWFVTNLEGEIRQTRASRVRALEERSDEKITEGLREGTKAIYKIKEYQAVDEAAEEPPEEPEGEE